MSDLYCYPNTDILKNKLGIRNYESLKEIERDLSSFRTLQLQKEPLKGSFDLKYLKAIHKYIFQDLYDWGGKIRNVSIAKGTSLFALPQYIEPLSNGLFSKMKKENYLKGLDIDNFSDRLSYYAAEINAYHPFREGNGRATREFIRCLANEAGYSINYTDISQDKLYSAFVKSMVNNTELKLVFKNHIINSIKSNYMSEMPGIKKASEDLLNKLHQLKSVSPDKKYLSIKEINKLYNELGQRVEDGFLNKNNSTFKLISDTNLEIRKLQAYTRNEQKDIDKVAAIRKSRDIEI